MCIVILRDKHVKTCHFYVLMIWEMHVKIENKQTKKDISPDMLTEIQFMDCSSITARFKFNKCTTEYVKQADTNIYTIGLPWTSFLNHSSRQVSSVTKRTHGAERTPGHHILHRKSLAGRPFSIWSTFIHLISRLNCGLMTFLVKLWWVIRYKPQCRTKQQERLHVNFTVHYR